MGSVNITLANGQLGGTLQTNDGIAGLVVTGATEGAYTVGTPILITSVASANAAGITETGNEFALRQVKEFYAQAGSGAQLYLMLVPATMTVDEVALVSEAAGARKLLDYAGGRIKLLGVLSDDAAVIAAGSAVTVTNGVNEDVYAAATNMAALAQEYFEAHKPFRAVIGGTSYSGTAAALTDMATGGSNNRTAIVIGDTVAGKGACVGMVLGVLSTVPVQRKISRVRNGPLSNTNAFLATTAVASVAESLPVIAGKGFITFMTYPNTTGYYFSGDPTCAATTDDYSVLARGRVIDKAHVLAYATFVQVVDDEVPVTTDGTLEPGFCKWLSQQIENLINNTMTANREISSVKCFIDPEQNILSTNQLNVVIGIVPVGYATQIEISLGFNNPAV